jgi:hypothetical protein
MPGAHPRLPVPADPSGAVVQAFPGAFWLAAGGALGVAAVATSSMVLGGVAAAATVKGIYDWATGPTTEMIPDVPAHYLSADASAVRYTYKGPDRQITGVQVSVRPVRQGAMRQYSAIDVNSHYRRTGVDRIDMDYRREQELVHMASELVVADIRVPRGRRPTRYEPDQGDHTVAWTLMTLSLERLAGRSVHNAFLDIMRMAREEWNYPGQNPEAQQVLRPLIYFSPQILQRALPALDWQRMLSEALDCFLSANQLASHATYKRRGAKTHAIKREDIGLGELMEAQDELSQGYAHVRSTARLADAAEALLDVQFNPSLRVDNYAQAVASWIKALRRAFPDVMAHPAAGPAIRNQVLNRPVPPGSQPAIGVNTVGLLLTHYGLPTA